MERKRKKQMFEYDFSRYWIQKNENGYSVFWHAYGADEELFSEIETFAEACTFMRDAIIGEVKAELDEIAERYDDIPDD